MLDSKKFGTVTVIITAAAVLASFVMVCFPDIFSAISKNTDRYDYPEALFGKNIMTIDITVDQDDWDDMIANKTSKPYIACDMKINGEQFDRVGIRPKGNSSLTNTQGSRIGFRLDFDHYIDNQTCHGLTQFVLNNTQADATYMKDYIAYDLMQYEGVDAPLHTFAYITLNGEPFGVYLAAEVYEKDYLRRVYNDTSVRLYNVKSSGFDAFEKAVVDSESAEVISSEGIEESSSMGGPGNPPPGGGPGDPGGQGGPGGPGGQGGGPPSGGMAPPGGGNMPEMMPDNAPPEDGGDMPEMMPDNAPPEDGGEMPEMMPDNAPPEDGGDMPDEEPAQPENNGTMTPPQGGMEGQGGPGGPPGMSGGGGDLVYSDDSTDSYQYIFANAVFDDTDAKDYARVIRAIKYLNKEGVTKEELETYWNVDEILRYLAVHTFMVNGDSYIGSMMQNYYIAEKDGKITILPWDYNLSFGSFGGGPGGGAPGSRSDSESGAIDETTQAINFAIDTPVDGVNMEDRPLVSVLLSFDEYKDAYHYYLSELTDYVPGDFINKLEIVENDIYPYIEKDATAFFTPDEHLTGFRTLKEFLRLRCQSIKGQLDGSIPSVTSEQTADLLVQSDISVNDMGSMGGGPGGSGGPPEADSENRGGPPGMDGNGQGGPPGMDGNGQGGPPGMGGNGQGGPPGMGGNGQGGPGGPPPPPGMGGNDQGGQGGPPGMQGGGPPAPPGMEMQSNTSGSGGYTTFFACLIAMILACAGLMLYKRRF